MTELVSRDVNGVVGTDWALSPSLSADGRYVAFHTLSVLVPEDTNGQADVYVRDRLTGALQLVSQTAAGVQPNFNASRPAISADGRYVVFETGADNLLPLENATSDVFLKDLQTGALTRISNAHLSPAAGNGSSSGATLSDDGRYVAFESYADDLVVGDTNSQTDVFVHDRQTGLTERVSVGLLGEGNEVSKRAQISGDGSAVVFQSDATNLVLFDLNGQTDVFLGRVGQPALLVSHNPIDGVGNDDSWDPSISYDGGTIAYSSDATDLVASDVNIYTDIFVYDVATRTTELVSLTPAGAQEPENAGSARISRDGGAVVFVSKGDFAPGSNGASLYTDIFLRDLDTDTTWVVSRPSGATSVANQTSSVPCLAQQGAIVAFESFATNLAPDDNNLDVDVFVRTTHRDPYEYCTVAATSQGCQPRLIPNGFSSVSAPTFLTLIGDELPNQKTGLLFYGFSGQSANPWGGSTMCVAGQKRRTPLLTTAGNPVGDDCTGFFAFDMNGFAAGTQGGNPKPELSVVGQRVNTQFWGRDPLAASGTFLSTAVEYVVGP